MRDQTENPQRSTRPTMTWVQVQGADGRSHLEARWVVPTPAPAVTLPAASHAA